MDLDRIKQRAYEIWEEEGRPEGRQQEHWDRVVREITGSPDQGLSQEVAGNGAGLQSGADGNLSEAAGAMRELSGGTASGGTAPGTPDGSAVDDEAAQVGADRIDQDQDAAASRQ